MKTRIFTTVTSLLLAFNINAQIANYYDFSHYTMPYEEINDGIVIDSGIPWESNYTYIPVNIDFSFFGISLENITIDKSPWSKHGLKDWHPNDVDAGYQNYMIPHPYRIIDNSTEMDSVSISPISFKVIELGSDSILVVQWKNIGIEDSYDNSLNYQIWLYQNSDIIEFHYGSSHITNEDSIIFKSITGLTSYIEGLTQTEYLFTLGGISNEPDYHHQTFNMMFGIDTGSYGILDNYPTEGQVYRFAPYYSVGLEEKLSSTSIYPNPTHDILTIKNEYLIKELVITDISGKAIKRLDCNLPETTIDISELDKGIYLIGIRTERKWSWEKIVKQ